MVKKKKEAPNMSKQEMIGFHKGSLSVLAKERQEMTRILQIIEQLMQMHLSELKELGVDLGVSAKTTGKVPKKPPIDELI